MQVTPDVLAILSRAQTSGNTLVIVDQLDRALYARTNKVLEAAGGKWNRRSKAHVFSDDATARVDQIILTGQIDVPKDDFNFFPTPPDIVQHMMAIAGVRPGKRLLEPQAGRGNIAFACADAGATVDCYELMKENADFLASSGRLNSVQHMDFLEAIPVQLFDLCVSNPPFLRQADIKHVQHALRFIKPTGKLVSVMSAGVTFRDNKLTNDFRALIAKHRGNIEHLAEGAFKSSGTMVSAVIVTIPGRA